MIENEQLFGHYHLDFLLAYVAELGVYPKKVDITRYLFQYAISVEWFPNDFGWDDSVFPDFDEYALQKILNFVDEELERLTEPYG